MSEDTARQDTVKQVAQALVAASGMGDGPGVRLPSAEGVAATLNAYRDVLFPEIRLGHATRVLPRVRELRAGLVALICAELSAGPLSDGVQPAMAPGEDAVCPEELSDAVLAQLPALRATLVHDLNAALRGDPAARSAAEVVRCYPGFLAIEAYRLAHVLWQLGAPLCARMTTEQAHRNTGIDIHPGARIAEGLFIDHGTGVVIGETAVIGRGVRIYQGVTVGARSVGPNARPGTQRHPTIEDDVIVYANATLLGGDTVIGRGAIIGGNAWVTTSVPAGARLRIDVGARVADAVVMVPDGAQP